MLERTSIASAGLVVGLLEVLHGLLGVDMACFPVELFVGGLEVPLIVVIIEVVNNGAKAGLGSSNRSVDEGEFSNVVLIDHSEQGFLFDFVDLGVLDLGCVDCFEFSLRSV